MSDSIQVRHEEHQGNKERQASEQADKHGHDDDLWHSSSRVRHLLADVDGCSALDDLNAGKKG